MFTHNISLAINIHSICVLHNRLLTWGTRQPTVTRTSRNSKKIVSTKNFVNIIFLKSNRKYPSFPGNPGTPTGPRSPLMKSLQSNSIEPYLTFIPGGPGGLNFFDLIFSRNVKLTPEHLSALLVRIVL